MLAALMTRTVKPVARSMDNKKKQPPKGNVKFNITLSEEQKIAKEQQELSELLMAMVDQERKKDISLFLEDL